ncbi:hypothetical protein BS50DRAFT_182236 [Corynespora cassiicola Philippines]|uniref:Arrestin-like N-terminal domain-containing protein n=1 Tax=Corynespora cassiicola Philippines TaxID=1448308 RepID=A0A2T2P6I6_CORCC|nr:hypothetical protein BS50DRAFT_182236 [Corynespora cassiicola Philippines]
MANAPILRVIVDDDSTRVYRRGDTVTGRVMLGVEEEEEVKSLRIRLIGTCVTKTTRPSEAELLPRREYEERIRLFTLDKELSPGEILNTNKYSWNFEFIFPDLTEPQFSRWSHGTKYFKNPHPLPPSFSVQTNVPGGNASVSYYLQAKLVRGKANITKKVNHVLAYHPTPDNMTLEARLSSRILYAQAWKPVKDTRTTMNKVFTKVRRSSMGLAPPRIVPTLHYPERVSPGQHIPLLISLQNTRDPTGSGDDQGQCMLDSLSVTISTYTTAMCGQHISMPEDVCSKHVTCIEKNNMNSPLPFQQVTKLTTNFRLVDDAECVPSFRTYTITRRYNMTVVVGIKFQDQSYSIRSTSTLNILPRVPRELRGDLVEDDELEIDPLPLYMPREPSHEFAPDYETLYSISPTSSTSHSLALTEGSSSVASGDSTPVTMPTTPSSEFDQPILSDFPHPSP